MHAGSGARNSIASIALDPLYRKRFELRGVEQRVGAFEHVARRVDLTGIGLGHHARCEVDRVAHDRIGAAVGRADVAGEDGAAMDADADRQRKPALDDLAQCEKHVFFAIAGGLRRAGGKDELAAVVVDVGAQERDLQSLVAASTTLTSWCNASAAAAGPLCRSTSSLVVMKRWW